MGMTVVALRRPLADRVAIQAPRMLENSTRLDKQCARAFGLIRNRREGLRPSQIFGAGERSGGARQNDHDERCFHQ